MNKHYLHTEDDLEDSPPMSRSAARWILGLTALAWSFTGLALYRFFVT